MKSDDGSKRTACAVSALVAIIAAGCSLAGSPSEALAEIAGYGEEIVFIAPSHTGRTLRAVRPDGSGAREVFALPDYAGDGTTVWELSASPDGRQIAFSSNHDWDRSLAFVNVYVIDADGTNLRRPSDAPSIPQLDGYQTGKVRVDARRLVSGGELSVYVQGARAPVTSLLRKGQSSEFTLEVADFGTGIAQHASVYNGNSGSGNPCHFDPAVQADVQPGQTIDAGEMPMLHAYTCPRVWSPAWIDNDRLAVLYSEPSSSISPDHNIWTVNVNIQPGETGARWLDTSREVTTEKLTRVFAGGTEGDEPFIAAFQSAAVATGAYWAPVDDPGAMQGGFTKLCGDTITCKLLSLDATPDGEITVISALAKTSSGADFSLIYLSRGDAGAFEQILKLEGEVIGTAAISPDGGEIVFDRARQLADSYQRVNYGERPQCPCSIWRVEADGSNLTKIVDDGRAPDWSR